MFFPDYNIDSSADCFHPYNALQKTKKQTLKLLAEQQ